MTSTTIAQRVFKGRTDKGGIMVATAKLEKLGGNKLAYFSITTANGCDHESILASRPDLQQLVDMHLSDSDGSPMHAVGNAAYYVKQTDDKALSRHLRIPVPEARDIISDFVWARVDILQRKQAEREAKRQVFDAVLKKMPPHFGDKEDMHHIFMGNRNYKVDSKEFIGAVIKVVRGIRLFYGLKKSITMRNIMVPTGWAKCSGIIGYDAAPMYPGFYSDAADMAFVVKTGALRMKRIRKSTSEHAESNLRMAWSRRDIRGMKDAVKDLQEVIQFIRGVLSIPLSEDGACDDYMRGLIDPCFRSYWQRQADDALEMLQGPDDDLEVEEDENEPQLKVDGEVVPVEDVRDRYVSCGRGTEYIIYEDATRAGEAAREYWVDMSKQDKEEFKCMVGEDNILAWAMGERAGPGSSKVDSMEEWFDLWLHTPHEHFASYDGKEVQVLVNKELAEQAGFDYDVSQDQGNGWVKAVGYRC